jgi:hypothetical protein
MLWPGSVIPPLPLEGRAPQARRFKASQELHPPTLLGSQNRNRNVSLPDAYRRVFRSGA